MTEYERLSLALLAKIASRRGPLGQRNVGMCCLRETESVVDARSPTLTLVATAHSGRPFMVVLLLTLGVWASALIPRDWFTSDASPFHITTGSARDLADAVRSACHRVRR